MDDALAVCAASASAICAAILARAARHLATSRIAAPSACLEQLHHDVAAAVRLVDEIVHSTSSRGG